MQDLLLTPVEARVIAALAEKAIATPQYYPMTLNALMLAANQKNNREPVMKLTEGEVGAALNRLQDLGLCARDDSLGRVPKWRHQFHHHLLLQGAPFAVLLTLMLRGPQTAAELRAHASALGGPDSVENVQAVLRDLGERAQPLVLQLPRGHGQKEARYAHTLCGTPSAASSPEPEVPARAASAGASPLEERVRALEERLAALERRLPPEDPGTPA